MNFREHSRRGLPVPSPPDINRLRREKVVLQAVCPGPRSSVPVESNWISKCPGMHLRSFKRGDFRSKAAWRNPAANGSIGELESRRASIGDVAPGARDILHATVKNARQFDPDLLDLTVAFNEDTGPDS